MDSPAARSPSPDRTVTVGCQCSTACMGPLPSARHRTITMLGRTVGFRCLQHPPPNVSVGPVLQRPSSSPPQRAAPIATALCGTRGRRSLKRLRPVTTAPSAPRTPALHPADSAPLLTGAYGSGVAARKKPAMRDASVPPVMFSPTGKGPFKNRCVDSTVGVAPARKTPLLISL